MQFFPTAARVAFSAALLLLFPMTVPSLHAAPRVATPATTLEGELEVLVEDYPGGHSRERHLSPPVVVAERLAVRRDRNECGARDMVEEPLEPARRVLYDGAERNVVRERSVVHEHGDRPTARKLDPTR